MILKKTIILSLLFATHFALSLPQPHQERSIIEKTPYIVKWKRGIRDTSFGEQIIPLRIGLTQSNLDKLDEELMKVSDPFSENYGKHWDPKDIAEFFAPSDETVESVQQWLHDSGIKRSRHSVSSTKGWIHVPVTINEAEALLATQYHPLHHDDNGEESYGCYEYSVPNYVRKHVDFIVPTLKYQTVKGQDITPPSNHASNKKKRGVESDVSVQSGALTKTRPSAGGWSHGTNSKVLRNDSSLKATYKIYATLDEHDAHDLTDGLDDNSLCWNRITPSCLYDLYSVPSDLTKKAEVSSSNPPLAVVEYAPQTYSPTDLEYFLGTFNVSRPNGYDQPKIVRVDGGNTTNLGADYDGESNLDLQYTMGIAPELDVAFYEVGENNEGSFNDLLDALDGSYCTYEGGDDPSIDNIYPNDIHTCGGVPVARVISTSYGQSEADASQFYNQRQCTEYGKLGLAGTTFVYSSGDDGVGSTCLNEDGSLPEYPSNTGRFAPDFPVSCPYVLAVGATQMTPYSSTSDAEQACENVIYSGGGFSDVFPIPDWQASTIENWRSKYPPPYSTKLYNQTSRGYPDVSANGANYVVYIGGSMTLIYGTSASAPLVASFLALINNARFEAGKGPIGYINPVLYSSKFEGAFNDITSGTNPGCGTQGFSAVPGWDPVTGLGTPKVDKWLEIFLGLP